MSHLLGMHWFRTHPNNPVDFAHTKKMGYLSYTIYNNHYDNQQFCQDLLANSTPQAIFCLRDQPLSEQKGDMYSKPAETGKRHADEWHQKFQAGKIFLPADRCVILGINEPDSNTSQTPIDIYFDNFLDGLGSYGLRGGLWGFGVGHPSTISLDPHAAVDWSWYKKSAATGKRLNAIAISHEYWMRDDYNWGNWAGRMQSCPYDLPWIIQEGFIDSGVVGKYPSKGWQDYYTFAEPAERLAACESLNYYQSRISEDHRIHSFQPFCYDENLDWNTFDIRPMAKEMESYAWSLARDSEGDKNPVPPLGEWIVVGNSPLSFPIEGKLVRTQRFGENPADYARFNIPGHNGVDYGAAQGSTAISIADGEVQWIDTDKDYGNYVRIFHPAFGFHSFYGHFAGFAEGLVVGMEVKKGQPIGQVGMTGNATGPHVHLEIRLGYADGSYKEGTYGYGKGRVDPETVYALYNYKQQEK